ncbi:lipopolysaccharide biosynthesis protein [Mycoplana rhizolycopersici]|uniref:Lipopolysaccharide biosynthesis protein n=1 Tax=Mycoplana rhizolycopersici TaxID=2746702 RepID=A0ABX2Q7G1_9HYPH|nr:lipopolysaccharide biosynthesis protein [Rhizobium rhizolycopersici]NVP53647.1 lipopolysaccharide biosynthesis protein [Rhizobium rhizolycopersici]
MAVIQSAEKLLPNGLRRRVAPVTRQLAEAFSGNEPHNLAQRMALIAFAIRVASAAIAFISQIIMARMMGEFEYGIFVFVWVLVIIFGNLSCLGFHSTVIRFLPHYSAQNAHPEIRGLTSAARTFSMLSATALATVGLLALWLLQDRIESFYVVPVFLGIFCLPMIALGDVLEGTARAHSWAIAALSPTYIVRPLLILVFMVAAVTAGAEHIAQTAMAAALAATYLTSLVQFFDVGRRLHRTYSHGPRRVEFSTWIRMSLPIFLIEGFGFLLTNSDVVVVGLVLDPESVAIYYAAAKTMALVHFVLFAVKAAAAPRFASLYGQGDREGLAAFAGETVRWSFWPSLAVGLGVLLVGHFLLSLFGPAFTAGYEVMVILLVGILAKASVGPGEVLLMMAGQQKLCMVLYAVALAANIGLNVALIPPFGIDGAAIATAGAMAIEAALLYAAVRRMLGITIFAFASPATVAARRDRTE